MRVFNGNGYEVTCQYSDKMTTGFLSSYKELAFHSIGWGEKVGQLLLCIEIVLIARLGYVTICIVFPTPYTEGK